MLKAGTFIRNTIKRALNFDTSEDYPYEKRVTQFSKALELENFCDMFEHNPLLRSFLTFDVCYLLADNYLIAMAIIYLIKARIYATPENVHYFLSALYLAHEMEEDSESLRSKIIPWYPGKNIVLKLTAMHHFKNQIWIKLNFNCYVSKESCDNLMKETPHWNVWTRKREEVHSGALRLTNPKRIKCKHCIWKNDPYSCSCFHLMFDTVDEYYSSNILDEGDLISTDWEIESDMTISDSENLQ